MDYSQHVRVDETPQNEPIPGSTQVPNNAGGFGWTVDQWTQLDRFITLGSEGGTYYVNERKLTQDDVKSVLACVKADGPRTVRRIVEISHGGRAPKNDPAIFALALAVANGDPVTRECALAVVPNVCRIGTHLFLFVQACEALRPAGPKDGYVVGADGRKQPAEGKWSRSLRETIAAWYARDVDTVAYQAVKYAQRNGWTHLDLLRLSHAKPATPAHEALFRWIRVNALGKDAKARPDGLMPVGDLPRIAAALESARRATSAKEITTLIREHDLPREAIESADTKWLQHVEVWEALLEKMPMTAMVRNLARMTALGLIAPMSAATKHVVGELANTERIRKSRVHPIALLSALKVYAQGHGERGNLTWQPVSQVVDALDAAFYAAFENAPSTGKRIVLACDVSGSMAGPPVAGIPGLSPRDITAALALVTAAREPNHVILAFSARGWSTRPGYDGVTPLDISPRMRLDTVLERMRKIPFGGTDCALPMLWALENKVGADGFVVLTDSETWAGRVHPSQALKKYRSEIGIQAKSVVVGMVSNGFTIADPKDSGMLDVVGCDTATPGVIAEFIGG